MLKLADHNSSCTHCKFSDPSKTRLLFELKSIEGDLEDLTEQEKNLRKHLMTLNNDLKFITKYIILPDDCGFNSSSLLKFLMRQQLPGSLYQVMSSNRLSASFLLQSGLVSPRQNCKCGLPYILHESTTSKNLFFSCDNGHITSLIDNSIWDKSAYSPQQLLSCIMMFLTGCREGEIRKFVGGYSHNVSHVCSYIRKIVANHYVTTLPKFRGVVEIDESAFRRKLLFKNVNAKGSDKWVFGLYERERKIAYLELVKNRLATTLIPIIQKICEPGTTIISDQWAAYNKLAEFGFPHYTVDHSRFFVNPHSREIHTQDIEITWGWAKYEIKRQNRGLFDLENCLHFFCWKRQFKDLYDKENEIASMLKALCEIVKNGQFNEKKMDESLAEASLD